jgi:DNA-binding transcriptional regulator YhcF (GntR family)
MSSRREVEQKRNDLMRDLRENCRDGSLQPGALAPPVRELAERYGISNNVVHRAVQELIKEGTLYSVPGVGTFVQRRQTQGEEYYLSTDASMDAFTDPIQVGFSQRIAQRGGATLTLPLEIARESFRRNELPPIAGIFGYSIGFVRDIAVSPLSARMSPMPKKRSAQNGPFGRKRGRQAGSKP